MKIECIVSMADAGVRLQFLAMERSLRAVGCELPMLVIPFSNDRFELPKNCSWWEVPEIIQFLDQAGTQGLLRKYQCLTISNYHFLDSDVICLANPATVMEKFFGFVVCCPEWRNTIYTVTSASEAIFKRHSTVWQQYTFNVGHFACDRVLYSPESLLDKITSDAFVETCLRRGIEQPGLNLLVLNSGVPFTNLTLPPHQMESPFVSDYPDDFESYWKNPDKRPYLVHWAGRAFNVERPINRLLMEYLTEEERREWNTSVQNQVQTAAAYNASGQAAFGRFKQGVKAFLRALKR